VQHRTGTTVLKMKDSAGNPLSNADVSVEQTRHSFSFGNIGFDFVPLANHEGERAADSAFGGATQNLERIAELWLDLYNTATLPFYWRGFEPEKGKPDTARIEATAEWFRDREVTVKGHPLVWHTLAPAWLTGDVEAQLRQRIRREVTDFRGLIDTWDAINEVVIMPVFEAEANAITELAKAKGRVPMIQLAFDEARAANPTATLLLNDFDLSERYEHLIEETLTAGVQIDALGLQTHMHQGYWGEEKMLAMVDRFARFGLPLHLTESTLLSGHLMPPQIVDLNDYQIAHWPSTPEGEERQADEMVRHYRSLVSHPAVEAITYWGITDDGAWLGAPVGLVRGDGTPKPSYDALHALIKGEWWLPPTTMRTDADGRLEVTGFFGDYRATAHGETTAFSISR
jgi:endo-1,4-beta-xylanase